MRYLLIAFIAASALALAGCSDHDREVRVDKAASHLCGRDHNAVMYEWGHWKDKSSNDPADSGESSLTAIGCNTDRRTGEVYQYDDDGYIEDNDSRTDEIRHKVCPETDNHRVIIEEHVEGYGKAADGNDWFWILKCSGSPRY